MADVNPTPTSTVPASDLRIVRAAVPGRRSATPVPGLEIESFGPAQSTDPMVHRFVELGARLQAGTPGRIVTSVATTAARMSPDFAFYAYGTARFFVARRDGVDVARCAAQVNSHARDERGQVGYIGMWECIEDEAVAHALLDAAVAHLVQEGCASLLGPVDFSTWYGYRFTSDGFDGNPIMLEPYTPPHYDAHWRSYGWTVQLNYMTTLMEDLRAGVLQDEARKFERALEKGYTFVHLRMNMYEKVLKTLYRESMKAFANNPNFTPIDWEEFRALYEGADKMMDPRLVWFALAPDSTIAGFAFAVPDHARAARALEGRSDLRHKLRALWNVPKADGVLFKSLMVSPDHRGNALSVALCYRVWSSAYELGYRRCHHVLMHEHNVSLKNSERGGTKPVRRYSVYELPLEAGA